MRAFLCHAAHASILLLGDWGGVSDQMPSSQAQRDASMGMAGLISGRPDVDSVLLLGNNFNGKGVSAATAEQRFKQTFMDVYAEKDFNFTFHALAGSNDHLGDPSLQFKFGEKDSRWVFPSLNYTWEYDLTGVPPDGGKALFVMIDTFVLVGAPGASGPADKAAAEAQWAWIDSVLAGADKLPYIFVVGHYSVLSVCGEGPNVALHARLQPMLEKYRVTAYLGGHDHCLGYTTVATKWKAADGSDGQIGYVVSGAGGNCLHNTTCFDKNAHTDAVTKLGGSVKYTLSDENSRDSPDWTAADGGFVELGFCADGATVRYYRTSGDPTESAIIDFNILSIQPRFRPDHDHFRPTSPPLVQFV